MAEQVEIIIEGTDKASKPFKDIGKSLDDVGTTAERTHERLSKIGSLLGGALKVGAVAAVAGVAALTAGLVNCVQEAQESEAVTARLNAVLKSTGGVAGVTAKQAQDLAGSLAEVTRFEDDAILSGENMLLTFTNIGKNVFPQATETILDMSTALNQDLQSSAIQLGKALQDPIEGVTALRRVGVQLTDAQEAQIKALLGGKVALEEMGKKAREAQAALGPLQNDLNIANLRLAEMEASGNASASSLLTQKERIRELETKITDLQITLGNYDVAQSEFSEGMSEAQRLEEAQKIILGELNREFGGAARAAGETFAGKLDILKNKLGEVKEDIGMELLPVLSDLVDQYGPKLVEWARQAGEWIKTTLVPALRESVAWLEQNLPAAIQIAGRWLDSIERQIGYVTGTIEDWRKALQSISDWFNNASHNSTNFVNKIFGYKEIDWKGYASGTSFAPGGPALVGERGPELVNLPRGASVTPNGGILDYGRLAAALAAQPVVVEIDGERVATVVRARLQLRGAGAMGW